jgi:hypothetical protein
MTRILSAVNEVEAGAVQSFTIFDNGTLSGAISSISTGGNGPAHVFASPDGEVSAMNVSYPDSVRSTLADDSCISSEEEMG